MGAQLSYCTGGTVAVGQSSSVMLLQNTHTITTERRVKKVSKSAPFTRPDVLRHMCTLITYSKTWPMANKSNDVVKYTNKYCQQE